MKEGRTLEEINKKKITERTRRRIKEMSEFYDTLQKMLDEVTDGDVSGCESRLPSQELKFKITTVKTDSISKLDRLCNNEVRAT